MSRILPLRQCHIDRLCFPESPSGSGSINIYLIGQNASGRILFQDNNCQLTSTWQRFTLTGQAPNGMTRLLIQIGDTFTAGEVFNVWGSQMEIASTAGPYVMTSALPVVAGQELVNLLPSSQQVSGPSWGVANGSTALNSVVAPDGSTTAATITATANSPDTYAINWVPNPSLYDSQTLTASVYLRVPSGTLNTYLFFDNTGDSGFTGPNLPVTLTTTWQRFIITTQAQNGLTMLALQIGGADRSPRVRSFRYGERKWLSETQRHPIRRPSVGRQAW